jgi:hypothetical protein
VKYGEQQPGDLYITEHEDPYGEFSERAGYFVVSVEHFETGLTRVVYMTLWATTFFRNDRLFIEKMRTHSDINVTEHSVTMLIRNGKEIR